MIFSYSAAAYGKEIETICALLSVPNAVSFHSGRKVVLYMENNAELFPAQNIDAALAEIESTLDQMLILAKMSASDLELDREALQKTLERLQNKIDRIADGLEALM